MAFEVISTHLTSQYTIHADDEVYVMQGASVTTNIVGLAGFNDGNMYVRIDGTVVSGATAVQLGLDGGVTADLTLFIGQTGVVSSLSNATGVFINRTGSNIINHGEITADYRGLLFGLNVTSGSILNTGLITTATNNAVIAFGKDNSFSGTFDFVNSGLIHTLSSSTAVQIQYQNLDFNNSGVINGGTGISVLDNIAETNSLSLHNSGEITGRNGTAIYATASDDSIVNSGSIIGNILMASGNDTFDGRGGTVQGFVLGDAGDDTFIIDNADILLGEYAGQGTDLVKSTVSYALGDNFENLTLIGSGNTSGYGNSEDNTLVGNFGANTLRGKAGADIVNGGDGEDRLNGGGGGDTLGGGADDDVLRGGKGNDTLNGGGENDVLIGGTGKDNLTGGGGEDVFRFVKANHSLDSSLADSILDFTAGDDLIDLSALPGTLAFISGAFTGAAEVRISETGGGDSIVRVDVDGDGSADMKIKVVGVVGLDAGDFLL